jgi:hypothetical protein
VPGPPMIFDLDRPGIVEAVGRRPLDVVGILAP